MRDNRDNHDNMDTMGVLGAIICGSLTGVAIYGAGGMVYKWLTVQASLSEVGLCVAFAGVLAYGLLRGLRRFR